MFHISGLAHCHVLACSPHLHANLSGTDLRCQPGKQHADVTYGHRFFSLVNHGNGPGALLVQALAIDELAEHSLTPALLLQSTTQHESVQSAATSTATQQTEA